MPADTWTADSMPPSPCCGVTMKEERDWDEHGGKFFRVKCPECGDWVEKTDRSRITIATAPWTRDLWAEVERLRAEVDTAEWAGDLHRDLNRRCAEALGLTEMQTREDGSRYLPSWHDMPERIAALRGTLREVLAAFSEHGHPGKDCERTGWVDAAVVARWREVAGMGVDRG